MRWASERQRMNRRLINVVYPAPRASNIRAAEQTPEERLPWKIMLRTKTESAKFRYAQGPVPLLSCTTAATFKVGFSNCFMETVARFERFYSYKIYPGSVGKS